MSATEAQSASACQMQLHSHRASTSCLSNPHCCQVHHSGIALQAVWAGEGQRQGQGAPSITKKRESGPPKLPPINDKVGAWFLFRQPVTSAVCAASTLLQCPGWHPSYTVAVQSGTLQAWGAL